MAKRKYTKKEKTVEEVVPTINVDLAELSCKTREEMFLDLRDMLSKPITAFEMAAKENRELAYRIIAAKKTLERVQKTLK